MTLYRDEGIVLRTQKLGEADRIVTVLTRRGGRIRAAAKGVRKTKSRFGARLEPFTHVDLQFYERRSLDLITQAETLRPYGEALVTDYPRYTAGTAMLETAEKLTAEEGEPALRQFLLLVGGLRTLAERAHDPRLVLDAFLLRSLSVAGWAPALDECCRCGNRGGLRGFAIAAGGAVCAGCRRPGAATPAPPTFALMLALLRGDWEYADASEQRHRMETSGLVAAYLQWHLEHGIRSLRHVERDTGSAAEHADALHTDTEHTDTGHRDTGHRDTGHRDTGHRDTEHTDALHAGAVRADGTVPAAPAPGTIGDDTTRERV